MDYPALHRCRCRVLSRGGRIWKAIDWVAVSRKICTSHGSDSDAGTLPIIYGRGSGTCDRAARHAATVAHFYWLQRGSSIFNLCRSRSNQALGHIWKRNGNGRFVILLSGHHGLLLLVRTEAEGTSKTKHQRGKRFEGTRGMAIALDGPRKLLAAGIQRIHQGIS